MADKNIQMTQRNAANTAWDNIYPVPAPHKNTHLSGGSDPIPTATTSANGLMSSSDKSKLDGVAAGSNNYVHPASHPPAIITQDANNRFVTDAEKSAWNSKAAGTHAHTKSQITDFPALATVATSGNYADLSNKPAIPTSLPANGGNADYATNANYANSAGNSDTVDNLHVTGSGARGLRAVTSSTVDPSGGADGDVWIKYDP